jgi:hypothetical protein
MGDTTDSGNATEEVTEATSEAAKAAESTSTEEKKFTQADIDKAVQDRHNRDKASYVKLESDFAEFKTSVGDVDALKKAVEDLSKEKDELVSSKSTIEKDYLRTKIAYKVGLDEDGFALLSGTTEDELNENAARIKKLAGNASGTVTVGNISSKDFDEADASFNNSTNSHYKSLLAAARQ